MSRWLWFWQIATEEILGEKNLTLIHFHEMLCMIHHSCKSVLWSLQLLNDTRDFGRGVELGWHATDEVEARVWGPLNMENLSDASSLRGHLCCRGGADSEKTHGAARGPDPRLRPMAVGSQGYSCLWKQCQGMSLCPSSQWCCHHLETSVSCVQQWNRCHNNIYPIGFSQWSNGVNINT